MSRILAYNNISKDTFRKEAIPSVTHTGIRTCAYCRSKGKKGVLYRYWWEQSIGGNDTAPPSTLPFCCIEHYRKYFGE